MKKRGKKILAFVLFMALSLSGVVYQGNKASAEENFNIYIDDVYSAVANTASKIEFTTENSNYLGVGIYVAERKDMFVGIYVNGENTWYRQIAATDSNWDMTDTGLYYYVLEQSSAVANADYAIHITFSEDLNFAVRVVQMKTSAEDSSSNAYINKISMTLTKGFSETLEIVDNTESLTWSSSNTGVAVVDQNGKVTGKKKGKATITAVSESGKTYSCEVTVKNNEYTDTAMNIKNAVYGKAYISITKVAYKNGGLVIKANYLNYSGHTITALKNVKIKVKNQSGKVIGTYSLGSKNVTILHGHSKSFTYTIKKSKLKLKKTQDLRNAKSVPTWQYRYRLSA